MINKLEKDQLIGNRYRVVSYLDEGGMQYVYIAHDSILNRQVALKTPKIRSAEKRFQRSAIVAAKINHPNIAKTLDYIEENDIPYLIEELISGEDLDKCISQKVKFLDPALLSTLFHKITKGLAASHHAGVIHRDLKPTNIMVNGGFQLTEVKITDFGVAKMAESEINEAVIDDGNTLSASATALGAVPYMAPEAITQESKVSLKSDIWSIGAMMYEFLTGEKPFGKGLAAIRNILDCDYKEFPKFTTLNIQFRHLSQDLIKIIKSCLQLDPCKRPTADELVIKFSNLCYSTKNRETGVIHSHRVNTCGFIMPSNNVNKVFFHKDSVYGKLQLPSLGKKVLYAKYDGAGADRAHPVLLLN